MEKIEFTYSLKNLIINILGNLFFISVGLFLFTIVDFSEIKIFKLSAFIIPLVSITFIYSYGKALVIELLNFNKKIIFSNNGVEYDEKKFEWNNISKPKVISKKGYENKFEIEEVLLTFQYKTEKIEIKIDNYNTNSEEISSLLKKYKGNSSISQMHIKGNVFDDIIGYEDYIELDENKSEKAIANTIKICSENTDNLKQFCEKNLFKESDKINFIFYCLSEYSKNWDTFLTTEFLRIYEISILENKISELFPLLENITVEDIESQNASKIREKLTYQLNSNNIIIRFKTLELLRYWVDADILKVNKNITTKIRAMQNDQNWKIRWNAHKILEENNVFSSNLIFVDKLRAKILNQYEL